MLKVIGLDGVPEQVSMGFGLGVRQHEDVMLSTGYTKAVEHKMTLNDGEFMIIRLDVGACDAHHAERRFLEVYNGAAKFSLIEVAEDDLSEFDSLSNPVVRPIINQKGPAEENSAFATFTSYDAADTNPLTISRTPGSVNIYDDEIPLRGASGGIFTASDEDLFSAIRGRHYGPNRHFAVIVESEDNGLEVYYRYQYHDYVL